LIVALLSIRVGPFQGTTIAFALDAASYLLSALLLLRLPVVQSVARSAADSVQRQVLEGVRFLMGSPQLRTNTLLLTIGPLFGGGMHTLTVGYAWRVSHTDALGFATLETALAVGAVSGVFWLERISTTLNTGRVILLGFAAYGLSVGLTGLTDQLPIACVLFALAGVANITFLVPSVTMVQRQTPSALRARVFGVRLALTYAAFSASNAAAGFLAEAIGVQPLLLTVGGALLLMTALAWCLPSARQAT
jgi:hypothetical protein